MTEEVSQKIVEKGLEEAGKTVREFLGKLANESLVEGGGLLADQIKFWKFKNQVRITLKAKKFLEDEGLDPQKVLPSTLIPLLEKGSLESDEKIQDKWAALLANAAKESGKDRVRPGFVQILSELSPQEVLLLDKMHEEVIAKGQSFKNYTFHAKSVAEIFGTPMDQVEVMVDNFYRLQLCEPPHSEGAGMVSEDGDKVGFQMSTKEHFRFTALGNMFVNVCRFDQ